MATTLQSGWSAQPENSTLNRNRRESYSESCSFGFLAFLKTSTATGWGLATLVIISPFLVSFFGFFASRLPKSLEPIKSLLCPSHLHFSKGGLLCKEFYSQMTSLTITVSSFFNQTGL